MNIKELHDIRRKKRAIDLAAALSTLVRLNSKPFEGIVVGGFCDIWKGIRCLIYGTINKLVFGRKLKSIKG